MSWDRRRGVTALAIAGVLTASAHRDLLAQPSRRRCAHQVIGPLVANIPSVEVQPQFRLNGKPFPAGSAGAGMLTLWASQPSDLFDGPQLSLGRTDEPPQPVRVVPGVYDVYYSWLGGPGVPRNHLTRVRRRVGIRGDGVLKIDVPMVQISGIKQHNGAPFADDGSEAELSLRSVDVRGDVPLGGTQPAAFSVRIIPGTYSFQYDWTAGGAIPRNRHATVRQIRLETDVPDLVLDVPSVSQDFTFLHNGAPFPAAEFDYGDIVLARPDGAEARIGSTYLPPPTVRLIPGAYAVRWRHVNGASVPRNEDAEFGRGVVVDGAPLVIDVPSLEISGAIRLNGQAPPASEIENGRLSLTMPGTPDRAYVGQTSYGGYQLRVLPGRYDVVYEHLAGATIVPANPRGTFVQGWEVGADPHRTLDVPVGTYEGVFLLNGEPFPQSEIERGTVYAVPLSGGDAVYLGSTSYGGFSRRLLPGLYKTAYAHETGSSIVPANGLTTFGPTKQVLQGGGTTPSDVLEVRSATLTVGYEHNGAPMPPFGAQDARVYLHRGGKYHLELLDSFWGAADRIAMEGRFELFYQYREGPGLPQNVFMPFGCWILVR